MNLPAKAMRLRGHVSGRLVAVAPSHQNGSNVYWACVCTCGKRSTVRATLLAKFKVKSCGCWGRELAAARKTTYGRGRTSEAAVWRSMKARCNNIKSRAYRWYGGRGIWVCQRWLDSFDDFTADMGPRPLGAEIDRIDNNSGYCCGKCADCIGRGIQSNCRWSTEKDNQRNKRSNVVIEYLGAKRTIAEWSELTGIKYGTLWKRHNLGWAVERMMAK